MRRLVISIIIQLIVQASLTLQKGTSTEHYQVEVLEGNPGLYYERFGEIRLKRAEWRIVIHLHTETDENYMSVVTMLKQAYLDCEKKTYTEACAEDVDMYQINAKIKELSEIQRKIEREVKYLRRGEKPMREPLPGSIRRKRLHPLGVIGSISKTLFGLSTVDDVDLINKNIDQLFEDQKELTHLETERIHIISQTSDKLYKDLANRTNFIKSELEGALFSIRLARYSRSAETVLDKLIQTSRETLHVLSELKVKKIPPKLFKQELLQQIIYDIRRTDNHLEFPLSMGEVEPERLVEICQVDAAYKEGKVFAMLHIPLTDRNIYNLYKIHPINVNQPTEEPLKGTAQVQPSHEYLAIDTEHRHYMKLDSETIRKCNRLEEQYLCAANKPLQETATSTDCELNMLIRPGLVSLKRCKILFHPGTDTQWTHLETNNAWLFSTRAEEDVRVLCKNYPDSIMKINGTGILRLQEGCTAKTDKVTIISEETKTDTQIYIYNPKVNLRISQIYPMLEEHMEKSKAGELEIPEIDWKEDIQDLKVVDERLRQISKHKRELTNVHYMVYAGLTSQLFIVIIIIGTVLRCTKNVKQKPTHKTLTKMERGTN